jgi:8-oxo-dGTP diphosphatase
MKRAACCFVLRADGKILAIDRKGQSHSVALIGGKVEPHEQFRDAAVRELLEEAGLRADPAHLRWVFTRSVEDFVCETYLVTEFKGEPQGSSEGPVRWVDPEELFDGPFAEYNRTLLASLRKSGIIP